jgi:hypothetical protein
MKEFPSTSPIGEGGLSTAVPVCVYVCMKEFPSTSPIGEGGLSTAVPAGCSSNLWSTVTAM